MARPKVLQDINTLYTENDTQDTNLINHNASASAHASMMNPVTKYNVLSGTRTVSGVPQTVTVSPIPTTNWVNSSGALIFSSGDYTVESNSYYSSNRYIHKAFDGTAAGDSWGSAMEVLSYVIITLPTALRVTKIRAMIQTASGNYVITGSNDKTTWSGALYTGTGVQATMTEMTLNNTNPYRYYKITFNKVSPQLSTIHELEISEYLIQAYTIEYSASNLPTTFIDNQRLLVETSEVDIVGVNSNTVNGITIDTILQSNTRYELVYDSAVAKFYAKEV